MIIEYGLSSYQLKELRRFSKIFNKTHEQFITSCLGVVVKMYHSNHDESTHREPYPDGNLQDTTYSVEIPKGLLVDFEEYCDDWIYDLPECVNGIVGMVLDYLECNWNGQFDNDDEHSPTFGVSTENMNDNEKKDLLFKTNGIEDMFNEYFG